jgi:glutathione S-transferase
MRTQPRVITGADRVPTAMSQPIKIYGDLMSQPTRAVIWFCKLNNLSHLFVPVSIAKLEHRAKEYLAINPIGQVPVIDDNGFVVRESHTIMRYLKDKYKCADHWYPSDLTKRVKVDEYLDWHHSNTRFGAAGTFRQKWLFPLIFKLPVNAELLTSAEKALHHALKVLNNYFLGSTEFINSTEVSIADLAAYCELTQNRVIGLDLSQHPKVAAWMQRVEQLPHLQEVNEVLNKVIARSKSKL